MKRLFERRTDESPSPAAENRTLQRRRPQSLRKERVSLIEQGGHSPAAKRPQLQPGSSQTLKMRRQLESTGESSSRPSSGFFGTGLQLSKSSSFSKFREAFESGNIDNLSDDDSSSDEANRRPTGVQGRNSREN